MARATTHRGIIVGIDGSPASESATAIAFDEASRRGVDLVVLHACSDWGDEDFPAVDWSALEPRGQELLAERLAGWQEHYPDVTVRRVVVANHAADHLTAADGSCPSTGWRGQKTTTAVTFARRPCPVRAIASALPAPRYDRTTANPEHTDIRS